MKQPKVTVFISLFNSEKYIKKTIESVLAQTFTNFELLIIDDDSTDKSIEIIKGFNDQRIHLLINEENLGIFKTRNLGLEKSITEYFAVIDSDDIMYPTRLEKQVEFLDIHSNFGFIGTWTETIDSDGRKTGVAWKNDISPEKIPMTLLFQNCFTHSSIMMRRSVLDEEKYEVEGSEDYDLWLRLTKKSKAWNIPKVLTQYRIHETNITKSTLEKSARNTNAIIIKELSFLNIHPTEKELIIHRTNYIYQGPNLIDFIQRREVWLQKLKKSNVDTDYFSETLFEEVLKERWLISCNANTSAGFRIWNMFWKSDLSEGVLALYPVKVLKFFIKSLFKIE